MPLSVTPSKVNTDLISGRFLVKTTYSYPLLTFHYKDGTKSTLNMSTREFIAVA